MIQSQKRQIRLLPMLFAACVALFLASGAAQAQPKDIALTASPNPIEYGSIVTLSAQLTGPGLHAGKTVVFDDGVTTFGSALSDSFGLAVLSLNTSSLALGSVSVSADSGSEYNRSASISITILPASRTLSLSATPNPTTTANSVLLTAMPSAGAIAYQYVSGPCTLSGANLTANSPGTCVVNASIAANGNYAAATSSFLSIVINETSRTLSLSASPTSLTFGGPASILTANPSAGAGAVNYALLSGPCSLSGATLSATAAGTCIVNATVAAAGGYAAATSDNLGVNVSRVDRTLNLSASPSAIIFGAGAVALSAIPGVGDGAISYALVSGPCTLSGSTLTPTGAGTCIVNASVAQTQNYNAATSSNVPVVVNAATRTLSLSASPSPMTFGAGAATLSAIPSAGAGVVTYALVSGPCTLSGSSLTSTGAGTCIVNASIVADGGYGAATSSNVPVVVNAATRTLSLSASPSPMTFGAGAATLSAIPSAGAGVVTYALVSGPCTLSGSSLTSTGAGTCIVNASIVADGGYGAATSSNSSVVVDKAGQAPLVAVASPPVIALNSTSVLSTTGGSGTGPVIYTVTSGSCTISGDVLTANGVGSCTVTATKQGDANYAQVVSSAITLIINPLTQTIAVQASTSSIIVAGTANLTIVGAQGNGARTFSVASGPCTISGSTLTGVGVGTCSVVGAVAADSSYLAAVSAPVPVNVSQANASVALSASANNIVYGASVTFTAIVSGSSPTGNVTFKKGGATLATVALVGGQASYATNVLTAGGHVVNAIYSGDSSNIAATSNSVSVNVSRPNPALDPDVRGIAIAQAGALRRFAEMQIENVHRRLETLHQDELQCVGADVCVTYNHGIGVMQDQPRQPVRALGYAADSRIQERDPALKAIDLNARSAPGSKYLYGGPTIAIWSAGAINIGKYENNGALIDNRFNTSGVTAGADMLIAPGFKAGVAIGYGRDRTDVGSFGSKSTAGGLAATAYGSYRVYGSLFLDALAGVGDARMKSRRVLPGEIDEATGRRDGLYWYGSAALTWEQKWDRLLLAPYLRFDVIAGSLDSYVESGPRNFALAYDSASIRSSSGIVGLRGAYDIPMDWGVLAPMARLEYRRVIENDVTQSLSYANEGGIVYPMLVNGASRNLFQAGLGLRARRDSTAKDFGVSGEIEYLFGTAGSDFTSHALRGAVKIAW